MSTKKTGDTEVIAENTKKRNKNRELEEHIIEKLFLIVMKKSVQEKVSEDSRSTKSIVNQ